MVTSSKWSRVWLLMPDQPKMKNPPMIWLMMTKMAPTNKADSIFQSFK
jgi:hypothetical protein